jgi:hypothetical protein
MFLCKYIRVDAVERFLQETTFSDLDKERVLNYCLRQAHSFLMDEIDLEDLDGDYFIKEEEILRVKEKLVSSGEFKNFDLSQSEFVQLIKSRKEAG